MTIDLNWIAPTIAALAAAVMAYRAERRAAAAEANAIVAKENAAAAKDNSAAAKEQSQETYSKFDGHMDELLKLVKEKATADATAAEKEAERARKATTSAIANGVAAGVSAVSTVGVKDIHTIADEQAKKLIAEAALVAAKLLADAEKKEKAK